MNRFSSAAEAITALEEAFELLKVKHPDIQEELQSAFTLGNLIGVVNDFGLTHGLDEEVPRFLEKLDIKRGE